MDSVITASLTVLGGVIVYMAGRVIEQALIVPVNEQSAAITEALEAIEFYRSNICKP